MWAAQLSTEHFQLIILDKASSSNRRLDELSNLNFTIFHPYVPEYGCLKADSPILKHDLGWRCDIAIVRPIVMLPSEQRSWRQGHCQVIKKDNNISSNQDMLAYVSNTKQPQIGSQWFTITKINNDIDENKQETQETLQIESSNHSQGTTYHYNWDSKISKGPCWKGIAVKKWKSSVRCLPSWQTWVSDGFKLSKKINFELFKVKTRQTRHLNPKSVARGRGCDLQTSPWRWKAETEHTFAHTLWSSPIISDSLNPVISANLRNKLRMVALLFTHTCLEIDKLCSGRHFHSLCIYVYRLYTLTRYRYLYDAYMFYFSIVHRNIWNIAKHVYIYNTYILYIYIYIVQTCHQNVWSCGLNGSTAMSRLVLLLQDRCIPVLKKKKKKRELRFQFQGLCQLLSTPRNVCDASHRPILARIPGQNCQIARLNWQWIYSDLSCSPKAMQMHCLQEEVVSLYIVLSSRIGCGGVDSPSNLEVEIDTNWSKLIRNLDFILWEVWEITSAKNPQRLSLLRPGVLPLRTAFTQLQQTRTFSAIYIYIH